MKSKDRIQENQILWDQSVPHHAASDFYDVPGFLAGRSTLDPVDVELMGDVDGLSLVHLQCHFGMDTLSWARLGARVTGVDISAVAMEEARKLADRAGLEATFTAAPVDADLPSVLDRRFDRVYTGGGALCWLPDIAEWGRVVADLLAPGGRLVLKEIHPALLMFDFEGTPDAMAVRYPYFNTGGVTEADDGLCYAAGPGVVTGRSHEWAHSLGEVVQALIDAGLRIEQFHEYPYSCFEALPFMEKTEAGWVSPVPAGGLPCMYSVVAVRE